MTVATLIEEILGWHRRTTADDVRHAFGDYRNLLHWLTVFLTDDQKLADACIVDACTIAETQAPEFHEWLKDWAARATVKCVLNREHEQIAQLARQYEDTQPARVDYPPLSPEQFRVFIRNSGELRARLDVLCRFVVILRGIANESAAEVAAELGVSSSAVENAYSVAYGVFELVPASA